MLKNKKHLINGDFYTTEEAIDHLTEKQITINNKLDKIINIIISEPWKKQ